MTDSNGYSYNRSMISPNDVLLGRGGTTNHNVGNKRYRSIVADHQAEYLVARKPEKAEIARKIVAIIHSNGGRFLRRDSASNNTWVEVTMQRAKEKTSQCLREGLDVKRGTKRPKKQAQNYGAKYVPKDWEKCLVRGRVAIGAIGGSSDATTTSEAAPQKPQSPALVSLSGGPHVPDQFLYSLDEKVTPQKPSKPTSDAYVERVFGV